MGLFRKKITVKLSDLVDPKSVVKHPANYSGGFILFGGWIKVFDLDVPGGTRGHELYLAFGGLGAGGWSGNGDLCVYMDKVADWNDFYNRVRSFMYVDIFDAEDPDDDPGPGLLFYDGHSTVIGGLAFGEGCHCFGVSGGTVKVES